MGKLLNRSSAEHLQATLEPFEHLSPVMDMDPSDWCQDLRSLESGPFLGATGITLKSTEVKKRFGFALVYC